MTKPRQEHCKCPGSLLWKPGSTAVDCGGCGGFAWTAVEKKPRQIQKSQVAALTASLASVTHELEETKRWLQEEGARGNTCRAENAALAKEIERNKYEFEVSHRVVQAHKQAEQNAVRIGCENITAREKAEASLAELRKRMGSLEREVQITIEQWDEEIKEGRPGIVFGSRMGQLKDALASPPRVAGERNK